MRLLVIFILSSIFCNSLLSQTAIPFETYFFTLSEKFDEPIRSQMPKFDPVWFDKIEFRTGTNRFDLDRQQYNLRISPSNRKANRIMGELADAYANKFSLLDEAEAFDVQLRKYFTVIRAYKMLARDSLQRKLLTVLTDQDKVYQKLLDKRSNYAVKWLDVRKEISEIKIAIFEDVRHLSLIIPDNAKLQWDNLINIDDLESKMNESSNVSYFSLSSAESDIDRMIIDKEMELLDTESSDFFDFIQLEYNGPSDISLDQRLSLTAAFQLPVMNNRSRLKMTELQLEKLEQQKKSEIDTQMSMIKISDIKDDILILLGVLQLKKASLLETIENSKDILDSYSTFVEIDPLIYLQHKEMIIKGQLEIINLESKILESYIEYKFKQGVLNQDSNVNYLSNE